MRSILTFELSPRTEFDPGTFLADRIDHGVYHLKRKPRAILDGSAKFVCPDIRHVLQELVGEVTIGCMNLDACGQDILVRILRLALNDLSHPSNPASIAFLAAFAYFWT